MSLDRMNARSKSKGFTVIELMASMVAFSILVLAVGSMLYFGWLGWWRNMESVAMQRDAVLAMRIIEHRIRNASFTIKSLSVDWNASQLTFTADDDYSMSDIAFDSGVELVPESVSIESNDIGGLFIEFALRTGSDTDQENFEMTVYPRN